MRVMVIVKATANSEAGEMPSPEFIAEMGRYNQKLIEAKIMRDAAGLKSSEHGARISLDGDLRAVAHGPFGELGELASGYWLWQVDSLEQAIDWAKQCPTSPAGPLQLEIRPLYEMEDFR